MQADLFDEKYLQRLNKYCIPADQSKQELIQEKYFLTVLLHMQQEVHPAVMSHNDDAVYLQVRVNNHGHPAFHGNHVHVKHEKIP